MLPKQHSISNIHILARNMLSERIERDLNLYGLKVTPSKTNSADTINEQISANSTINQSRAASC